MTPKVELPAGPGMALRRARWAVLAIFLLNGIGLASWAAEIPMVKERFALSDGALGFVLLAVAAGSVVALLLGGRLVAVVGSRALVIGGEVLFCLLLALLLILPALPLLVVALVFFGASIGIMEVAANVQALGVETQYQRPLMSTFHALFSVGGLAGSAVAGFALARQLPPGWHLLLIAAGLLVLTVVGAPWLLTTDPGQQPAADTRLVLPTGPLLGLGVLAFFCLVSEGAMADWSAVYLRDSLHTTAGLATAGYAAFSLMMAVGRFAGDPLRARFSGVTLIRYSGLLSAVGLGVALLVGQPVAALVGFACVGLGLANVVPILFVAAGRATGIAAGAGIAAVASAGYFGFLVGPPLIGFVSQAISLPGGLGVVVCLLALLALLAQAAAAADKP